MRRRRSKQSGFTLVEVIIAAVIVAILAAVTVPTVDGMIDRQHAVDTIKMLDAISAAINPNTTTGTFRQETTRYPSLISQLATPIATTQKNVCNRTTANDNFSAAAVNNWAAIYPAVYFDIRPGTGAVTPFGENVQDAIVHLRATIATPTETTFVTGTTETGLVATNIALKIPNMLTTQAQLLDLVKDASDGSTSGTIMWVAGTQSNQSTVYYILARSATTC